MRIKNMMSIVSYAMIGAKICWMHDEGDRRISVMAMLPESKNGKSNSIRHLAEKAEKLAEQEANKVGCVVSTGVFMGGSGDGLIVATGIADLSWTPELEKKFAMSGIPQLQ